MRICESKSSRRASLANLADPSPHGSSRSNHLLATRPASCDRETRWKANEMKRLKLTATTMSAKGRGCLRSARVAS